MMESKFKLGDVVIVAGNLQYVGRVIAIQGTESRDLVSINYLLDKLNGWIPEHKLDGVQQ